MKYLGQRESKKHRWMKESLAECLTRTAGVDVASVRVEKRFDGTLEERWRRPDVRARWYSHDLVFEAQLDATHVAVIAQRDEFYRREQARLIWVFSEAPTERLRFVEKDILFNNHHNLFVFNEACRSTSLAEGTLVLHAYWIDPAWVAGDHRSRSDNIPWRHRVVDLSMLTLPREGGPPYFIDVPALASASTSEPRSGSPGEYIWAARLTTRIESAVLGVSKTMPLPDVSLQAEHRLDNRIKEAMLRMGKPIADTRDGRDALWHFVGFAKAVQALEDGRPTGFGFSKLASGRKLDV